MKIVVTGSSGFIGVHTVKTLREQGYDVLEVDLRGKKPIDFTKDDFEKYINSGDKILHLGAVAHFSAARENVQKAIRVNVEGTLNIVKSAIKKHAERIVYSSTGSVYNISKAQLPIDECQPIGPENEYGLTKKQAEDWVTINKNQLPYVILRYAYIYGVHKDWGAIGAFFKKLKNGEQPVIFGGKQSNDFTYVDDVVQANLLALETDHINQAFNIGTGKLSSIKDVCEQCIEAIGSTIQPKIEPSRTFDFLLFVYDISKAESILRYKPKWNVHRGIRDMAEKLRATGYFREKT